MITIELLPEDEPQIAALLDAHPDLLKRVRTRNILGGGGDYTLLISAAALAVPAIKAVLVERIRAGGGRTVERNGRKYVGYSPADIERMEAALNGDG
jgi:hypothetical protein